MTDNSIPIPEQVRKKYQAFSEDEFRDFIKEFFRNPEYRVNSEWDAWKEIFIHLVLRELRPDENDDFLLWRKWCTFCLRYMEPIFQPAKSSSRRSGRKVMFIMRMTREPERHVMQNLLFGDYEQCCQALEAAYDLKAELGPIVLSDEQSKILRSLQSDAKLRNRKSDTVRKELEDSSNEFRDKLLCTTVMATFSRYEPPAEQQYTDRLAQKIMFKHPRSQTDDDLVETYATPYLRALELSDAGAIRIDRADEMDIEAIRVITDLEPVIGYLPKIHIRSFRTWLSGGGVAFVAALAMTLIGYSLAWLVSITAAILLLLLCVSLGLVIWDRNMKIKANVNEKKLQRMVDRAHA